MSSLSLQVHGKEVTSTALPSALATRSRGTGGFDPFLQSGAIRTRRVFDLSRSTRAATPEKATVDDWREGDVLALEAEGGATLFISPQRLRTSLRHQTEAWKDGRLDLDALREPGAPARGLVGDFLWSRLSVLEITPDELIQTATGKAREIARDLLGKVLPVDWVFDAASWVGARALAAVVESRLLRPTGVYRWVGAQSKPEDLVPVPAGQLASETRDQPVLLFIHGTASNTTGSFGGLRPGGADWSPFARAYGDRVYAFEHRTMSVSPVENAIELAEALPAGTRLSIVTHSRGGLVGDLLCLASLGNDEIAAWRRRAAPDTDPAEIEAVTRWERERLGQLRDLLRTKAFRIERYVRVACPARGTLLASGNFDVFLSGLLSLVGAVSGLTATGWYSGLSRIVLEVAKRRADPQVIPGIEAMLPDAPLPALLARARRPAGIRMAVIAGDIEGGGFWQRLGVLFTDWMFFEHLNHDLVVNTDSMYEGLARDGGARALFDQGSEVSHFRYFENPRTRMALRSWLTEPETEGLSEFTPVASRGAISAQANVARGSRAAAAPKLDRSRPVVILLPGIMGSHLEQRAATQQPGAGDRIWFDVWSITNGGFEDLRWPGAAPGKTISAEAIFEMFYGKLAEFLARTHEVIAFPYDWRAPIEESAEQLSDRIQQLLTETAQPIRLLAHSMGGLVSRAMIAAHPETWDAIVARPGGRLVMLGTPNNGSHLLVQHLIGKAGTTRSLARIDFLHDLQEFLDVISKFPGALQLLPRPKPQFTDTANEQADDYFDPQVWTDFKARARDRWFGDHVAAIPAAADLHGARSFWDQVLTHNRAPEPHDRVAYVFGHDRETPCGVRLGTDDSGAGTIQILMTDRGDGSVTWQSGTLEGLPQDRYWYLETSHTGLTGTESAFGGILELLQDGTTQQLASQPPKSRAVGAGAIVPFEAGPPVAPTEEEAAAGLFGDARPRPRAATGTAQRLHVSVTAGDLRFTGDPIVCGHYVGDPIAGAESAVDRSVVFGGLRQRERLGLYAGEIGTATVVLMPVRETHGRHGLRRGAVIVGLGEFGKLNASTIADSIRAGTLRFLQNVQEERDRDGAESAPVVLGLAPLLVGYNSTTFLTIDDSLASVVRGVAEANVLFAQAAPTANLRVQRLEFVELYLDTAISAMRAALALPERLKRELAVLRTSVTVEPRLVLGAGYRHRLADNPGGSGYWPRLVVADAERQDIECPPECYEVRTISPIPPEVCRQVLGLAPEAGSDCTDGRSAGAAKGAGDSRSRPKPPEPRVAERLRFLFLSERARAEVVLQQRQPRLLEELVSRATGNSTYNEELSRTFFQLMVPLDLKEVVRHLQRLVLVVDGYTANLPWEMLLADECPLATRTPIIRQLASIRFRPRVRTTPDKAAYVVGNPSTKRFLRHFPQFGRDPAHEDAAASLAGAETEAGTVRGVLQRVGYQVVAAIGAECDAARVMMGLFHRPYRIVHIAAHGIFNVMAADGKPRSGVILSDGLFLTAVEVGQMEVVPEIVFLNCCHLAMANNEPTDNHRLAYGLARELIEMGVRCVVAAGWEVDDEAAEIFATTFYTALLEDHRSFGQSIHEARRAVWEQKPECNTWGAYQAYGDPAFVLERREGGGGGGDGSAWVTPELLVAAIEEQTTELGSDLKGRSAAAYDRPEDVVQRTRSRVAEMLAAAPADYRQLPEVQYALGRFHADARDFRAAIDAYQVAVRASDLDGRVPIKAIEQLANLESRHGEQTNDAALVLSGVRRMQATLGLEPDLPLGQAPGGNPERYVLYGSACKRYAAVLGRTGAAPGELKQWLTTARDAYAAAEGVAGTPGFSPFRALNRVQLALILGFSGKTEEAEAIAVVNAAAAVADESFATSRGLFDLIIPVDAALTLALMRGTLSAEQAELTSRYKSALATVPSSERGLDSVVTQLRLMSEFLAGYAGKPAPARILAEIANTLRPLATPASPVQPAAKKARKKTAKAGQKKQRGLR